MFEDMIATAKEFKAKNLEAAKQLQKAGAPRDQVNAKKTLAANVVSILESYICFKNMAKSNPLMAADCEIYAQEHLEKFNKLVAA